MYSAKISFILGVMVLTGAARTVTAKLFYQLGFDHPLFLTILYLTGQAMSLIPYNILAKLKYNGYQLIWEENSFFPRLPKRVADEDEEARRKANPSESTHGLPLHSRTQHHHGKIPWCLKPAIPAFFNLINSAMRWASLVFVAASVAEMLISGMELVLSVCATRVIRGRNITSIRWLGVLVVTAGIILVGTFDTNNVAHDVNEGENSSGEAVNRQVIGILLILGQSVMSVFQDLTEEVFMQEAEFPPMLLVGMEGAYGVIIALILYLPIAPLLGENPSDVANSFQGNVIALTIGWTLLVCVTGIFNIAATAVTSSMTRNVWKNMRTLLVWIMGLILFYSTGSSDLGESFDIPGSLLILLGYAVMCLGIFVYYGKGARATEAATSSDA